MRTQDNPVLLSSLAFPPLSAVMVTLPKTRPVQWVYLAVTGKPGQVHMSSSKNISLKELKNPQATQPSNVIKAGFHWWKCGFFLQVLVLLIWWWFVLSFTRCQAEISRAYASLCAPCKEENTLRDSRKFLCELWTWDLGSVQGLNRNTCRKVNMRVGTWIIFSGFLGGRWSWQKVMCQWPSLQSKKILPSPEESCCWKMTVSSLPRQ